MIKRNKIFIYSIVLFLFSIVLCSCGGGNTTPPQEKVISVEATTNQIELKDKEVASYNFKSLFVITVNDEIVEVQDAHIDKSELKVEEGTYNVKCTYEDKSASVSVKVTKTQIVYTLDLKIDKIDVKQSIALTYDYNSLFIAKEDGNKVSITNDMIISDVSNIVGTYSYTVNFNGISKTLIVNVLPEHEVEIVVSYKNFDIEIDKINSFDYTQLFTVYADGKVVQITNDIIDKSSVNSPIVGKTCEVTLAYSYEGITKTAQAKITIVENESIVITAKNVVTYPNDEYIDLTTLFEIKKGNEEILVTAEMISGSIDYSKVGNNEITLNYQGLTKVANVEVRRGVVIDFAKSDSIIIIKGTNINTYSFINDFNVTINGIKFVNIPESYFDLSNVNFNEAGTYPVKITIPYNEKSLSLSGVKFTYYEATINYIVVEQDYKIVVLKNDLVLPLGTTKYNVFSNLEVTINGKNQTLVNNKDYVDIISCYAEVLSKPIDFTNFGVQNVEIAVYVNGVNSDPVVVSYKLEIDSEIDVVAKNVAIFTGATLYTKNLFTITEGNQEIEVTYDMVSGKVDTFIPGTYYVSINYKNIEKIAKVIVFDNRMMGTYKTSLNTIPTTSSDYDEEYGDTTPTTRPLGDLVIASNGTITLNDSPVEMIGGIDENTMLVKYHRYDYTLHYVGEGIVVLDPNNDIKLTYNDDKRPMIYFNEDVWTLERKFVVNSTSSHVLESTIVCSSIDAFELTSKINGSTMWYGLNIALVEKMNSDTVYKVTWGEVEFAKDFKFESGSKSTIIFNGEQYNFITKTPSLGQVSQNDGEKKFANKIFKGTFNGVAAELRSNGYEAFSLIVDSKAIFTTSAYDMDNMRYGGVDYLNNTVLIYEIKEDFYSYKFALDLENLTFTYIEKDQYFGQYFVDNMYIFLDGYGTGHINFNTKSYYQTGIKYTVTGDGLELKYVDKDEPLYNGYHAKLNIHPFGNVLTARYFSDESLIGKSFENAHITTGAIVRINSYQVGAESDTVAKQVLYNNIEIITKDGVLDNNAKIACLDTSKVRFNTKGFYQFAIKINVNGTDVTAYYAIQVLEDIYESHPIVATYGSGVIFDENSLSIDKYGQVVLNSAGIIYSGMIKINEDNTFVISASSSDNQKITATGNYITKGLISLRCTGATTFSDYFTTGTVSEAGCTKNYLRKIVTNNVTTYIFALAENSAGEIVTVNEIENNIYEIVSSSNTLYVKVKEWGNMTSGIIAEDGYRGTYTNSSSVTLVVDGFGKVMVNSKNLNYTLNNNIITVVDGENVKLYKLDNKKLTYENIDVTLDNNLLVNKTYTGTHTFFCDSYAYIAETKFIFKENGKVTIVSTSNEHDEGDSACGADLYIPSYASKDGITGTFFVKGNKVTIAVNNETFVFIINNVLSTFDITCEQTSLTDSEHGYFSVGTTFRQ